MHDICPDNPRRPTAKSAGRKPLRGFDRGLADEIVAAVTRGVPMRRFLSSDRRLPCLAVVARWRDEQPAFAAELKMAMIVSRYVRGARRLWSEALEAEISRRIVAGCSLRQVAAQPDMPCGTTLRNWSHRKVGFREGMEWSADERGATLAAPMYRALVASGPPAYRSIRWR